MSHLIEKEILAYHILTMTNKKLIHCSKIPWGTWSWHTFSNPCSSNFWSLHLLHCLSFSYIIPKFLLILSIRIFQIFTSLSPPPFLPQFYVSYARLNLYPFCPHKVPNSFWHIKFLMLCIKFDSITQLQYYSLSFLALSIHITFCYYDPQFLLPVSMLKSPCKTTHSIPILNSLIPQP